MKMMLLMMGLVALVSVSAAIAADGNKPVADSCR